MTAFYTEFVAEQEEKSLKTIARALELGLNFFDTAWLPVVWRRRSTEQNE